MKRLYKRLSLIITILLQISFRYSFCSLEKFPTTTDVLLSARRLDELNLIVECVRNVSLRYLGGRNIIFVAEQLVDDLSQTLVTNLNGDALKVIASIDNVNLNLGFYLLFQNSRLINHNHNNNNDYYEEILRKLPPNNVTRFVLIWDFQMKIDLKRIQNVFEEFWSYKIIDVIVLIPFSRTKNIRVYTYYPFSSTRCGQAGPPILIDVWNSRRRTFVSGTNLFARYKKVFNLHGCPLRCVGIHRPPESTLTLNNDGWKLAGTGVKVFRFIQNYMNFTAVISTFRKSELNNNNNNNNNNNTNSNRYRYETDFDLAFGKFTRVLDGEPNVDFVTENQIDCFTWAVPHGIGRQPSIWRNYVVEFSNVGWLIIGVSIVSSAFIIKLIKKIDINDNISSNNNNNNNNNNNDNNLRHIGFALFFSFSTFVGAATTVKLTRNRRSLFRLFLSIWLFYSLVLMSGYQAYLGSLMTIPQTEPEINRQIDLINDDRLNLIGRLEMFHVLNESTATVKEFELLINRFFILTPIDFERVIDRMIEKRDIAVFTSKRELIYYAQRRRKSRNAKTSTISIDKRSSKIHVFTDCVVKSYSSAFMLRKGSPYRFPINNVLMRLFETGIYSHWDTDNVKDEIEHNIHFAKDTVLILRELYGAFVVLLVGLTLSTFVFVGEIFNRN